MKPIVDSALDIAAAEIATLRAQNAKLKQKILMLEIDQAELKAIRRIMDGITPGEDK